MNNRTAPRAELLTYDFKTEGLDIAPSFISIWDLQATPDDWLFTFGDDYICKGAKIYKGTGIVNFRTFVWALPDNPDQDGINGFLPDEKINIGIYKAAEGKFYELTGGENPNFRPLGLHQFKNAKIGSEITLNISAEYLEPTLEFKYLPLSFDPVRQNNMFFAVNAENVEDVQTILLSGNGILKHVNRMINTVDGWHTVNMVYEAAASDTEAIIKTTAKRLFSDETVIDIAMIPMSEQSTPTPDPNLFENEYFKIYSSGNFIWLEMLTNTKIFINFDVGTKYLARSTDKVGSKRKICANVNKSSLQVNWGMYKGVSPLKSTDWGQRKQINTTINW